MHANWVNRCDQKIVFEKQNGRGADAKYRWTAYKGMHDGKGIKFVKANSAIEKYDTKYFGTYRTRVEGAENAETYQDKRTNIWHNLGVFASTCPIFGALLVVACWYLWDLFKGGGFEKALTKGKPVAAQVVTTTTVTPSAGLIAPGGGAAGPAVNERKQEATASDYVAAISEKWRPRLSGLISNAKDGAAVCGMV
ncbi:hypothetical protein ACU4GD_14015 [Cupriavidus basilensis]